MLGDRWSVGIMLVVALAGAALGACGTAETRDGAGAIEAPGIPAFQKNARGYADIQVEDLADLYAAKPFALVNVHVPYEGEMPGTDAHVPFDQVGSHLSSFPEDKSAPILVYCRSGRMSDEAAAVLADLGYRNVMELDGGFRAWQAAGQPFDDG